VNLDGIEVKVTRRVCRGRIKEPEPVVGSLVDVERIQSESILKRVPLSGPVGVNSLPGLHVVFHRGIDGRRRHAYRPAVGQSNLVEAHHQPVTKGIDLIELKIVLFERVVRGRDNPIVDLPDAPASPSVAPGIRVLLDGWVAGSDGHSCLNRLRGPVEQHQLAPFRNRRRPDHRPKRQRGASRRSVRGHRLPPAQHQRKVTQGLAYDLRIDHSTENRPTAET